MSVPNVNLKNPVLAGVLAFLVPGAGHFYQGRIFKAGLYFVCIVGMFVAGMRLGNWQAVHCQFEPQRRTLGYLAQFLVGLPALPAFIQNQRYEPIPQQRPGQGEGVAVRVEKSPRLEETLDASFVGHALVVGPDGTPQIEPVRGDIHLENAPGPFGIGEARGVFRGTSEGGQSVEWPLRLIEISPKLFAYEDITPQLTLENAPQERIFASGRRYVRCEIEDAGMAHTAQLEGTVPRAFWNWFEVPLEDDALQHLHGVLGKQYEVALVLTWIAGLLNLLAIWDALEGPAYGYGYEDEEERSRERQKEKQRQGGAGGPSSEKMAAAASIAGTADS